jgi:hypothetical protein
MPDAANERTQLVQSRTQSGRIFGPLAPHLLKRPAGQVDSAAMPTMSDRSPGGSSHHVAGAERLRPLTVLRFLRRVAIALVASLLILPVGFASLAAASTLRSNGNPGSGIRESTANAYLTETEEEEAEEAEEDEAEELEEAEEIEEAEEGEAEAAEEEAEEEEAEEAAYRRHHAKNGARLSTDHSTSGSHSVTVSSLTLTATSKGALAHGTPTASKVSFSFALTSKSTVHFTLARSVGGAHWQTVSSVSVAANRGTDHEHLYGDGKLASGQYRLTLAPSSGHATQLTFAVK